MAIPSGKATRVRVENVGQATKREGLRARGYQRGLHGNIKVACQSIFTGNPQNQYIAILVLERDRKIHKNITCMRGF